MTELHLGISPCPNDTYIFEGWVTGRIPRAMPVRVEFADVQTLNEKAIGKELDIVKVSCGVLPLVCKDYVVMRAGGAMGYGCGPLLLGSGRADFDPGSEVWLPGENTTASLLFHYWYRRHFDGTPKIKHGAFDWIYRALLVGKISQAVVIHEHRFTWQRDGLRKLMDLGEYWEEATGAPLPLGVIIMRRSLSAEWHEAVVGQIRRSLRWAQSRSRMLTPWIRSYAQEQDEQVLANHINTFVNAFSMEIGNQGEWAIQELLKVADIGEQMSSRELIFAGEFLPGGQEMPFS